jgi:hypothetical protein
MEVGAFTLAALSTAGCVVCACWFGGPALAVWTFGVLVMVHPLYSNFIRSAWNPYATLMPFAFFLFLTAALAAGRIGVLPLWVLTGSFLVQTHVGYLPNVIVLSAVAGGILVVRKRRQLRDGWRDRRQLLRAGAGILSGCVVLVVLWLPPILEELAHSDGNLSKLLAFASGRSPDRSFVDSGQIAFTHLGLWSTGISHYFRGSLSAGAMQRIPPIIGVVETILLLAAATRQGYAASLCGACAVAALVSIGSVRSIPGTIQGYLIAWIALIGAVGLCGLGGIVVSTLDERSGRWRVATLACVSAIAACLHLDAQSGGAKVGRSVRSSWVYELWLPLREHLNAKGSRRPRLEIASGDAWPVAAGIMLQARKAGIEATVDSTWTNMFGRERAASGAEDLVVVVATRRDPVSSAWERIAATGSFVLYGVARPDPEVERELLSRLESEPRSDGVLRDLESLYSSVQDKERLARVRALRARTFSPQTATALRFGQDLTLTGYDLGTPQGRTVEITWYWRAERSPPVEYAAFAHFEGAAGRFQDDYSLGASGRGATGWQPGETTKTTRTVVVPDSLPDGGYDVRVGAWDPKSGQRLTVGPWWRRKKAATLLRLELVRGRLTIGPVRTSGDGQDKQPG